MHYITGHTDVCVLYSTEVVPNEDEQAEESAKPEDFLKSLSAFAIEVELKDKDDAETLKKQQLTDLASRIFVEVVSRHAFRKKGPLNAVKLSKKL